MAQRRRYAKKNVLHPAQKKILKKKIQATHTFANGISSLSLSLSSTFLLQLTLCCSQGGSLKLLFVVAQVTFCGRSSDFFAVKIFCNTPCFECRSQLFCKNTGLSVRHACCGMATFSPQVRARYVCSAWPTRSLWYIPPPGNFFGRLQKTNLQKKKSRAEVVANDHRLSLPSHNLLQT